MVFGWGYQPERVPAGVAIILYTIVGSLPLLLLLVKLYDTSTVIILLPLLPRATSSNLSSLLLIGITLGFLVKFPIYSLHL
jgi:NADH-ubiquinone oxidoreductase chain 4